MKLQTSLQANHLVRTDWLDQFNKQQQNYSQNLSILN